MADFKSWDALFSHLQKSIDISLEENVAPVVKKHISESVEKNVFSKGNPLYYDRRGEYASGFEGSGSLRDPQEMESDVVNGVLEVTDEASPKKPWNYGGLSEAISFGYGSEDEWWNSERPFFPQAQESLIKSGDHIKAMKKGLQDIYGKKNVT